MAEREKVIKGLECHAEVNCIECPYRDGWRTCRFEETLLADAIALLKEQEAVPVIQREVMHMLVWCCGSCGVAITDGDRFCRNCGRAVKWE